MAQRYDTDEDWELQLADYVFGVMEPDATREFERALGQCQERVQMAHQYRDVTGWLGTAAPSAEPPSGHKVRLMSRIASTPQEQQSQTAPVAANTAVSDRVAALPAPRSEQVAYSTDRSNITDLSKYRERRGIASILPLISTVAAALILLVTGFGWWSAQSEAAKSRNEVAALQRQLTDAQTQASTFQGDVAALQKQITDAQGKLNIPPGYIGFPVLGQDSAKDATGVVLFNPEKNEAFLLAQGLKPISSSQVYEFWLLPQGKDQKPVAAGTFSVDAQGKAQHITAASTPLKNYASVAVTLEPAPGSTQPTGPMLLVGAYALP